MWCNQTRTITTPNYRQHADHHPHYPHHKFFLHQHYRRSRNQLSRQPNLQSGLRLGPEALAGHRPRHSRALLPRRPHQRYHPMEGRQTHSLYLVSPRRRVDVLVHARERADVVWNTRNRYQRAVGGLGQAWVYFLWERAAFGG